MRQLDGSYPLATLNALPEWREYLRSKGIEYGTVVGVHFGVDFHDGRYVQIADMRPGWNQPHSRFFYDVPEGIAAAVPA
jgi:hypothetical protein